MNTIISAKYINKYIIDLLKMLSLSDKSFSYSEDSICATKTSDTRLQAIFTCALLLLLFSGICCICCNCVLCLPTTEQVNKKQPDDIVVMEEKRLKYFLKHLHVLNKRFNILYILETLFCYIIYLNSDIKKITENITIIKQC